MDSIEFHALNAGGPPLGTITNTAATAYSDINARAERWELQAGARRIMKEERVGFCLHNLLPGVTGVEVRWAAVKERAYYGNLMRCGSVWMCPVCAAQVSEIRRKELKEAITRWELMGGTVVLVTYTAAHSSRDKLGPLLQAVTSAQRGLVARRAYKDVKKKYGIKFQIKALEVTCSQGDGWHPHFHVLLFLSKPLVSAEWMQGDLLKVWKDSAAVNGLFVGDRHGVKVNATDAWVSAYVSKFGREEAPREWGPAEELSQWHRKRGTRKGDGEMHLTPFDLLRQLMDTGEAEYARLFREYCENFKGRKQLVWSPGMREALGMSDEVDDLALVQEVRVEDAILALITREEWLVIRQRGMRAQVLQAAELGRGEAVRALIDSLMVTRG